MKTQRLLKKILHIAAERRKKLPPPHGSAGVSGCRAVPCEQTGIGAVQALALEQTETGICIIDEQTNELYYANDAAFYLHDAPPRAYAGKTCCEAFYGKHVHCDLCWRRAPGGMNHHAVAYTPHKTLSTTAEQREWNGKRVVVVYQRDITEKDQLQKSVAESNRRFRELLTHVGCGVCVGEIDEDDMIHLRYFSAGFSELCEGSMEDVKRIYSANFCHGMQPEDMQNMIHFIAELASSCGTDEITYSMRTLKGNRKWITAKVSVVRRADGIRESYATCFDVTEHMQMQKQMIDMVHHVPGGVCMYRWNETSLEPLIISDQAAHLFGLETATATQVLRKVDYSFVHPDDVPELKQTIMDSLAHPGEEYSDTYRIWHAQKKCYRWIRTSRICVAQPDSAPIIYANYFDVNEAKELEQRLRQEEEMLQSACNFAHMWSWVYDIPKNRIRTSKMLQEDFGMPEYLEDFPESWLRLGFVLPQYLQIHRDKVQAIKDGSNSEVFEVQIQHKDGTVHWSRICFNRLERNRELAICTAQLIDDEKILQARVTLEKRKLLSSDTSMIGYAVINVTQNIVLECNSSRTNAPLVQTGTTLRDAVQHSKPDCSEEESEQYRALHDRESLLRAYNDGVTTIKFVGHRLETSGSLLWIKSSLNLVKDPATGDVYLYEYIYDIHRQKIMEEILSAIVQYDYERIASLNLKVGQMTIVDQSNPNAQYDMQIANYRERVNGYGNSEVLPEDRDWFLSQMCLEHVKKELTDKDTYEFVHRVRSTDGSILFKRTGFSYYNRDAELCLITRADVTKVMREEEQKARQLTEALEQMQRALAAKQRATQDRDRISAALFSIVPMVISSNLTANRYGMLNYDDWTTKTSAWSGTYDDLIAAGVASVPEEFKKIFADTFAREHMLHLHACGKKSVRLEHPQMGDDGVMRWIETRCIFVTSDTDSDVYTITLARNITRRKQQQLDLQRALETAEAATQAKSEFLSRMSHEIRTPMNAIIGMTSIAKDSGGDLAQISECLDKIDMSSHFLLTLINDILEMSRIESGQMEIKHKEFSFDFLMESIHTVVKPLAQKSGIAYVFRNHARTDSDYIGDAMRIQQVLVNILTNAVKFTQVGGQVQFSVNVDKESAEQTAFRFEVADTGIGMSEAFMKKMFEPFTQEDGSNTSTYGGSGLGLAISKNLMESMGGSIYVRSQVGVGSTFTVELPLERVRVSGAAVPPRAENHAADFSVLNGCHVLMAEDHPLNVLVACKLMERKGVAVTVAENGQVAVDRFCASEPGTFDAILMDIRMPVMDGLDAARTIRKLERPDAKTIPIIAMTANALDEDRRHSRDAGMNAHLAKPFEPTQIYTVLAEQIQAVRRA